VTNKHPESQSLPSGFDDPDLDVPPTARPKFDPEEFARDSDAMVRGTAEVPRSRMPTVPPPPDAAGSTPDLQEVGTIGGAREALGADAVPCVAWSREDLALFDLGAEATRLLGYVNGISSVEAICRRACVTAEEGAAVMLELAEQGVVSFR